MSLPPNFLDKETPMAPDKRANVPYLIEAMIICVIKNDFLNCKYMNLSVFALIKKSFKKYIEDV